MAKESHRIMIFEYDPECEWGGDDGYVALEILEVTSEQLYTRTGSFRAKYQKMFNQAIESRQRIQFFNGVHT